MEKPKKTVAKERIQKALDAIPHLKAQNHGSPEFEKWLRNTEVAIANTFGDKSRHSTDFTDVRYSLGIYTSGTPDSAHQRAYTRGLDSAASVLVSMLEEIEEYWPSDTGSTKAIAAADVPQEKTKNIFIIHGRDDGTKETVARFIATLGLTPIILHEQSNQGQTIIEKFERHARVGFAVALLTPDDVGGLAEKKTDLTPRARQNVIFEFGYFVGALGRRNVCALTRGNVEIPSDYAGVVYIPFDAAGAWKMNLVRELKASGYEVDANLAL
ncbi:MAG: nucleotide-binding protein [Elusimicrobia bacterium]|nr:nucleotide-binding protein [Elusimicrobiota bacterium]